MVNGGHRSGRAGTWAAWTTLRGRGSSIRQSQGPRPLWLRGLGAEQQRHFSGASRLIRAGEARCVAVEPGHTSGSWKRWAGLGWAGSLPRQLMEPALTA